MRRANVTTAVLALLSSLLVPPASGATPDRIVPAAVSAAGASGSLWRTMLVFLNASEERSRVTMVFRPAGRDASAGDPSVSLELAAGQTRTVVDVLHELFGKENASGSLDLTAAEGTLPLVAARVWDEGGGAGTRGLAVPVVRPAEALAPGERAALVVPDVGGFRVNVGVRTVGGGATLALSLQDSRGAARGRVERTFAADTLSQQSASDMLGLAVRPGDAILVEPLSGSAFVWATPIDDTSNDGSFHLAERVVASDLLTSDFVPPTGRVGDAMGGPGVMRLMTATSPDGLVFTRTGQILTDQGDVPDVVVDRRGWIFAYYVGWTVGNERNKVVAAISRDQGRSWVYKVARIEGFSGMADTVDPDVQILEDGTFRLYVTSAEQGKTPHTWVAEGRDGVHFTKVGSAFEPPPPGESLDPSSVRIGSTWHLYAGGIPGENLHATSTDGRSFTYAGRVLLTRDGVGQLMSNGVALPGGGARFYTFDAIPPSPGATTRIGSFVSSDGTTFSAEPGSRLVMDSSSGKESYGVKDSAVARLADGTWLMVYATRIP